MSGAYAAATQQPSNIAPPNPYYFNMYPLRVGVAAGLVWIPVLGVSTVVLCVVVSASAVSGERVDGNVDELSGKKPS